MKQNKERNLFFCKKNLEVLRIMNYILSFYLRRIDCLFVLKIIVKKKIERGFYDKTGLAFENR